MQKNEERIGIVIAVGMNGEGILKDEDTIIFVPFALPTEKIKYKVLKVTKKCAYGKLIEVLTPSEERVRPRCKVFEKCGGCQLQHIDYQYYRAVGNINDFCFDKNTVGRYIDWLEETTGKSILAFGTGEKNNERILVKSLIK